MNHTTFDGDTIKQETDLLTLIAQDIALRRVSVAGGGEFAGPCPRCGGNDRFHCKPGAPDGAWWFCRQCHPTRGDAIDYVRWRDGVDFAGACALLSHGPSYPAGGCDRGERFALATPPTRKDGLPSTNWQARGRQFVAYCEDQLHKSPEALAYLTGRGLTIETIRAAQFGYNPQTRRDVPSRWGMEGKPLWLPAGWIIPCKVGDQLAYIKVRQEAGDPKYVIVRGGRKQGMLYGLDNIAGHTDGILIEGEFNALILRQALAGIAGVASVGDAGNSPGPMALPVLARVRRLWTLHDQDPAGTHGQNMLAGFSARVRPLTWPFGAMDANDAYLAGQDLSAWTVAQIGPSDPSSRAAWAEHHLRRLGDEPGADDESTQTWRVWRSLLDEYTHAWHAAGSPPPAAAQ